MKIRRTITVIAIIAGTLASLWLMGQLWGFGYVAASPLLTATPTGTPVFSATLSIVPDRTSLRVGDILTLAVDVDVSQGCQYPILELSLAQAKDETPIFAPIDPPAELITGPVSLPSIWTFRATQLGTATFDARTYGERYCNDYWNWHYLYGQSESIHVDEAAVWLPLISH
ncbi:MAG: hypothetical protein KA170_00690 [Candidatus Promineofilum sp.]|nr:hypothetical protein [Promineifilum sp.]